MLPGVANLSGMRTFRVLRALRTISSVKGMREIHYIMMVMMMNDEYDIGIACDMMQETLCTFNTTILFELDVLFRL